MILDHSDSLGLYRRREYEPRETRIAQGLLRPGMAAIDIGAHIGYYTLVFAEAVGPGGSVISFEPNPINFDLLSQNVRLNGYNNVSLHQAALSDIAGRTRLFKSEDNSGMHRLYDSVCCSGSVEVDSVRLDDVAECRGRPIHLIKMDIEGFELHALKGMEGLLRENPAVWILAEFSPAAMVEAGVDPAEFVRFLTERGFTGYSSISSFKTVENPEELISALSIVKRVVRRILQDSNVIAKMNSSEIQALVISAVSNEGYGRPILENFLWAPSRQFIT